MLSCCIWQALTCQEYTTISFLTMRKLNLVVESNINGVGVGDSCLKERLSTCIPLTKRVIDTDARFINYSKLHTSECPFTCDMDPLRECLRKRHFYTKQIK